MARCLAGLGRIALEQGDAATARSDLSESLRLSYTSGSRTGMARGLEALARLALLEGQPETALRLAGAMTALRAERRPAVAAGRPHAALSGRGRGRSASMRWPGCGTRAPP